MPITPVPSMTTTPPFPALADRAAGTYNSKAYAFGTHMSDTFNDELVAVAESVVDNATDAAASAESSEENAALTAADRVQTGLDVIATAADRVQTGLDKVATAADRVQTGLDKVAAAGSATAAALAAEAAEAAAESISGGPVASVNGMTGIVTGVATLTDVQTLTNKTLTDCTLDGTNQIGYKNIPQNSQSTAYTTVLGDAGKHILHPSADTTARTFTIPANSSVAYPIGAALTFVNQNSAGVVTISITSDTMRLAGAGTTGSRTLSANGVATAIKITATEWIISGTGLT